jgi:hypothetical protein
VFALVLLITLLFAASYIFAYDSWSAEPLAEIKTIERADGGKSAA